MGIRSPLAVLLALVACMLTGAAWAHPHVWVSAKAEILYGADGRIEAVRHHWTFDEAYSSFAVQGLDANGDGQTTPDELAELAKTNLDSLSDWGYFTVLRGGGQQSPASSRGRRTGDQQPGLEFLAPRNERMTYVDGRMTLSFELPLKTPAPSRQLFLEVYDKTFFVDFQTARTPDAITLTGAPAGCTHTIIRAKQEAPPPGQTLPGAETDYNAFAGMGADFASRTMIACP